MKKLEEKGEWGGVGSCCGGVGGGIEVEKMVEVVDFRNLKEMVVGFGGGGEIEGRGRLEEWVVVMGGWGSGDKGNGGDFEGGGVWRWEFEKKVEMVKLLELK